MIGRIERKVEQRGFGFIKGEDGVERFFHHAEVAGVKFEELRAGDQVSFEPSKNAKGERAVAVRRA